MKKERYAGSKLRANFKPNGPNPAAVVDVTPVTSPWLFSPSSWI